MLVKSTSGLTLPGVYAEEVAPEVIIQGIQTSVLAVLGTASKGSVYETSPFASYDQDFIRNYGGISATGNKTNTLNYLSLPLAMIGISAQGGGQVLPIRIADEDDLASATASVPALTSGSYTIEAKSPGTWANGTILKVEDDALDTDKKKITITTLTGDEEMFIAVDNWVDEINSTSDIIKIVSQTGTDVLPANTSGITLTGGDNGVTLGSTIPDATFIGQVNDDGTHTGLELVATLPSVRFIVMSEHYARIVDEDGLDAPTLTNSTGGFLDPASVKAIAVAESIGAIVILATSDTLTYAQLKNLAQMDSLKGTDRVILTYPKMKMFEQTYKSIIDLSMASFYAGMWAGYNPNESPSNKAIIGGLGPSKRVTVPQKKDMSDIAFGLSAVADIPRGGIGPINGQNTSANGGLNQALRRRMADFILLSLDRALGDAVSALNTPTLRSSLQVRINNFLAELANDGLIGDSAGGPAYLVQISEANNPKASVIARKLNIRVVVSLYTPADFIIVKGDISFNGVSLTAA